MANIKIIDLPTGSPESTSFVEATQVDELAESGRSTVKLALNSLGNFVAGQGASPLEYGNLETESTTLIGAANELHNSIGAEAYDSTSTYNTDDYCIYNGELYKCNDDNVTGAWDATKWDLTKVIDELGGGNADYIECTQAQYDAWEQGGTLEADKMYFITDGKAAGDLVLPESIAAEYDDTASYTAGDFVMYEGILYKCNHISATGSFDPTKWDAISAMDYINSVKSSLNTNISQLVGDLSDAYSSSNTYAVGDLCILGNTLYKCNTAITTPEAWTPAHWTTTTVADEFGDTHIVKTNINPSVIPTGHITKNATEIHDINDSQVLRLEAYQAASTGNVRGQIVVSRSVGGTTNLNYLYLGIKPNGDKEVFVSADAEWRNALSVPQKLKIGTDVRNFSNGVVDVPLSSYNLSSKPNCVLLTPARGDVIMAYDWDQSSATNGLRITCRKTNDLTGVTGNVRFSIAILA